MILQVNYSQQVEETLAQKNIESIVKMQSLYFISKNTNFYWKLCVWYILSWK